MQPMFTTPIALAVPSAVKVVLQGFLVSLAQQDTSYQDLHVQLVVPIVYHVQPQDVLNVIVYQL